MKNLKEKIENLIMCTCCYISNDTINIIDQYIKNL